MIAIARLWHSRWRPLATLVLASTLAPAAHAQQGLAGFLHDADLTSECRKLLYEDPILGPLNLGVRVENRVAILWGPAPSREASRRAEQCLRTLIELVDVRNQMLILPDLDWRPLQDAPFLPNILPDMLPPNLPAPLKPVRPRPWDDAELACRGLD